MDGSKSSLKHRASVFSGGLLQVLLVVTSTTVIAAHSPTWLVMTVAFGINFNWAHNIRKVSFGDEWDRVTYGLGGAVGSGIGYVFGSAIAHWFV